MNYGKRNLGTSKFGTMVSAASTVISKFLDLIVTPTKSRCDAYYSQSTYAQEQMQRTDVSKRERRYWTKQHDKAMNGLAQVHNKNSETWVGTILAIGVGLLIGNKFFRR